MPIISLDVIVEGPNTRTIAASHEADEGLRLSIAAQGVLTPILLRPKRLPGDDAPIPINGRSNQLEIVLGARRWAAAKAVGLTEIPAEVRELTDEQARLAQITENTQRARMHPCDQWRGISALVNDGMTIEQAAGALGFDDRMTRRMERLGRLDPSVLALCEIEMPDDYQLRWIAKAPPSMQFDAATRPGVVYDLDGVKGVNWKLVVRSVKISRISKSHAIFDTEDVDIVWEEDLFAQPGDADQFTTVEIQGFLQAQKHALETKLAELNKGKKVACHVIGETDGASVIAPKGFTPTFIPDPTKPTKNQIVFWNVSDDGRIIYQATEPVKKPAQTASAGSPADGDDDLDDDAAPAPVIETKADKALTKAGLEMVARIKTDALRDALKQTPISAADVLAMLILTLSAENIVMYNTYGDVRALASKVLLPGGIVAPLSEEEVAAIGKMAISRILTFDSPDTMRSGRAAEWVGAVIGAQSALPRFDTEAFLKCATVAELKRIATGLNMKTTGSAADLRARLVGNAENYVPEAAVYGAPAPIGGRDVPEDC